MITHTPRDDKRALIAALARVACAIIGQTARDLTSQSGDHQASAMEWLNATEDWPFSIHACCEIINDWLYLKGSEEDRDYRQLEPNLLRDVLIKHPTKISASLQLRADAHSAAHITAPDDLGEFQVLHCQLPDPCWLEGLNLTESVHESCVYR
ncbi:MAG: hypothetical protein BGN88_02750 [Clostridiales bacterium 43-6]|jgi:hypothetical protein|nr:MAG: hypothetical protein BGN88_02750 [Clostridiales bacterium 43-6]